ncbi:MAG: extracellular solute-binding protein, partial [Bacillota bacterium]|nr:extracellular solute-binding protein [Bacillota bacterium]
MKRLILTLLAVALVLSLAVGCSPDAQTSGTAQTTATTKASSTKATTTASEPVEVVPMRYYMPGGPTTEADAVNVEINKRLTEDGVGIEFLPQYYPWDEWVNKINIALSTGEEFELLHIMEDYITTSSYTSRGGLTPLDDLITEHTPSLWSRFDDVLWQCATVAGKVMTVPAN